MREMFSVHTDNVINNSPHRSRIKGLEEEGATSCQASLLASPIARSPLITCENEDDIVQACGWNDGGAEFLFGDGTLMAFRDEMNSFVTLTPAARVRSSASSTSLPTNVGCGREMCCTAWTLSPYHVKVRKALHLYNRYAVHPRPIPSTLRTLEEEAAEVETTRLKEEEDLVSGHFHAKPSLSLAASPLPSLLPADVFLLARDPTLLERRAVVATIRSTSPEAVPWEVSDSAHSDGRHAPPPASSSTGSPPRTDKGGQRPGGSSSPSSLDWSTPPPLLFPVLVGVEVTLFCAMRQVSLTIHVNRRLFTVRWPSRLEEEEEDGGGRPAVWWEQVFPVEDPPAEWAPMLRLALELEAETQRGTETTSAEKRSPSNAPLGGNPGQENQAAAPVQSYRLPRLALSSASTPLRFAALHERHQPESIMLLHASHEHRRLLGLATFQRELHPPSLSQMDSSQGGVHSRLLWQWVSDTVGGCRDPPAMYWFVDSHSRSSLQRFDALHPEHNGMPRSMGRPGESCYGLAVAGGEGGNSPHRSPCNGNQNNNNNNTRGVSVLCVPREDESVICVSTVGYSPQGGFEITHERLDGQGRKYYVSNHSNNRLHDDGDGARDIHSSPEPPRSRAAVTLPLRMGPLQFLKHRSAAPIAEASSPALPDERERRDEKAQRSDREVTPLNLWTVQPEDVVSLSSLPLWVWRRQEEQQQQHKKKKNLGQVCGPHDHDLTPTLARGASSRHRGEHPESVNCESEARECARWLEDAGWGRGGRSATLEGELCGGEKAVCSAFAPAPSLSRVHFDLRLFQVWHTPYGGTGLTGRYVAAVASHGMHLLQGMYERERDALRQRQDQNLFLETPLQASMVCHLQRVAAAGADPALLPHLLGSDTITGRIGECGLEIEASGGGGGRHPRMTPRDAVLRNRADPSLYRPFLMSSLDMQSAHCDKANLAAESSTVHHDSFASHPTQHPVTAAERDAEKGTSPPPRPPQGPSQFLSISKRCSSSRYGDPNAAGDGFSLFSSSFSPSPSPPSTHHPSPPHPIADGDGAALYATASPSSLYNEDPLKPVSKPKSSNNVLSSPGGYPAAPRDSASISGGGGGVVDASTRVGPPLVPKVIEEAVGRHLGCASGTEEHQKVRRSVSVSGGGGWDYGSPSHQRVISPCGESSQTNQVILRACRLEGVGNFSMWRNGTVRAHFDDRTILSLIPGPSSCGVGHAHHVDDHMNSLYNDDIGSGDSVRARRLSSATVASFPYSHMGEDDLVVQCLFRDASRTSVRLIQCQPSHRIYPYLDFAIGFRREVFADLLQHQQHDIPETRSRGGLSSTQSLLAALPSSSTTTGHGTIPGPLLCSNGSDNRSLCRSMSSSSPGLQEWDSHSITETVPASISFSQRDKYPGDDSEAMTWHSCIGSATKLLEESEKIREANHRLLLMK